jgi:hypothetical protein
MKKTFLTLILCGISCSAAAAVCSDSSIAKAQLQGYDCVLSLPLDTFSGVQIQADGNAWTGANTPYGQDDYAQIVRNELTGDNVAQFRLRSDEKITANGLRSEMYVPRGTFEETLGVRRYRIEFYIPSAGQEDWRTSMSLMQWIAGDAPLALLQGNGTNISVYGPGDQGLHTLKAFEFDTWEQVDVEINWTSDPDLGYAKFTVGEGSWTYFGATIEDGHSPYFKVGTYLGGANLWNEEFRVQYRNLEFWEPIAAVPEPQTYAMLLAGLGIIGVMARRRRKGFP